MYLFYDNISHADKTLFAKLIKVSSQKGYSFRRFVYPDVHIPNRSLAWFLHFLDESAPEKEQLRTSVENYNEYLDRLEAISGFKEFFINHHCCVSRQSVEENWNNNVANTVFSKKDYVFSTDLCIIDDCLFDKTLSLTYAVQIDDSQILIPMGKDASFYPSTLNGYRIMWNWVDNGHDFCFFIWELLGSPYSECEYEDDAPDDVVTYSFDCYDQFRECSPEPQLISIFNYLETKGLIRTYTIKPEEPNPYWVMYGKSDGSIDLALVDPHFTEDKEVMRRIQSVLWSKS